MLGYTIAIVVVGIVIAWVFWPPRPRRHEHGRMPDTWRSTHAKFLDEELRQARARKGGRG